MGFFSIADPRVLAIQIRENGDPLVDISDHPQLTVKYAKGGYDPGDPKTFSRLRQAVVRKLLTAQKRLPPRIKFLVREGYRPLALQLQYFEKYREQLREKHPSWTEQELFEKTCVYAAPPDTCPPHTTGGAVDLTLISSESGLELDMGTPVNATPEESQNRCFTHSPGLGGLARMNRDSLIKVMETVDFVNYPSEWWHWSYGDRYWAYHKRQPYAIYGSL